MRRGLPPAIAEDLASEMRIKVLVAPDIMHSKKYLFLGSYSKIFGRKCERIFVSNAIVRNSTLETIIDIQSSESRTDILVFPDPPEPTDEELQSKAVSDIKAKSFARKLKKLKEFGLCQLNP
jgi:hypothetical protein